MGMPGDDQSRDEEDLFLDEENEDEADSTAFNAKLDVLEARCKAASIDFRRGIDEDGDLYAELDLPAGKEKRSLNIYSESRADAILGVQFEKFRLLAPYDGVYSYVDKTLEAGIRGTNAAQQFLVRRLSRMLDPQSTDLDLVTIRPPDTTTSKPEIELGAASPEFIALTRTYSRTTLKLRGIRSTQHEQVVRELRAYADSLFFQIDQLLGQTFIVQRERKARLPLLARRPQGATIEYPRAQYNDEAMSLYWYARSARDMPLLRFLAFYQSIEFYFPRYSQGEARKRLATIIKSPTFRPYRDDDLDRLILAIQTGRSGGLGNERSQLRTVVNECISADEMREYISASKAREEHFAGKGGRQRYHKISLANKAADLRNDVADRIYGVRCKIVHTKNEGTEEEQSMILPFSEDADYIQHDVELVQFVAGSVLVASSGELS